MTLTEIRLHLDELGVRPSRRLGQNFLHDQNLARRIVDLAKATSDDILLEIGPGLGALTEYLLEFSPNLTLFEKDTRLAAFLRQRHPQTQLLEGDAMTNLDAFEHKLSSAIVLGNLPYSVASPMIVRLCERTLRPKRMIFTIQREVADRLIAGSNTKNYGLLTLLTQPFYDIRLARRVPNSVFWPQPEVHSAVVTMDRREEQPFENTETEYSFREKVKQAFQKRRKTLGAIFGSLLPPDIDRARRPEELSIKEWTSFANPKGNGEECFDVVNERDEVIGQEPRSKVHRLGLWHRAIHIFVWNRKGNLLLQKRSKFKDVSPLTWDSSSAGHLNVGESYSTAANREIIEELGISLPLKFLRKFDACRELGWEFVHLYEAESEGPFQFPRNEISELKWWSPDQINHAIERNPEEFAPSFRHLWNLFERRS